MLLPSVFPGSSNLLFIIFPGWMRCLNVKVLINDFSLMLSLAALATTQTSSKVTEWREHHTVQPYILLTKIPNAVIYPPPLTFFWRSPQEKLPTRTKNVFLSFSTIVIKPILGFHVKKNKNQQKFWYRVPWAFHALLAVVSGTALQLNGVPAEWKGASLWNLCKDQGALTNKVPF